MPTFVARISISITCNLLHVGEHTNHGQRIGQVQGLTSGDRVVALKPGLGTWRDSAVCKAAALHKVPKTLPIAAAATLAVKYVLLTHVEDRARICLSSQNLCFVLTKAASM